MPYKPYSPGQRQLSARQLNEQLADIHALNNLDVDGASHGREGGVHTITLPHRDEGFWAKIDAEGSGSQRGRYAWTEQTLKDDGTFEELDGGRTGTLSPARDFAREYAGKTAVPVGLKVWMIPGTAGGSPTVAGQVNRNPVFVCPDLLQVVRVTDDDLSENGDYPGFVRRFDPTADGGAGAFVDAEPIWVKALN